MPLGAQEGFQVIDEFGDNPGGLHMHIHVPENLPARPALVVALHGCTQNAAEFNHGTGWSSVAERVGAVILFPEQQSANNANLCFSWYQQEDTTRDQGEMHSIDQMVKHAIAKFDVDPKRVFITGFSAGGAMASAMLAAYPDVYAAGAAIAGLPYGAATSVYQALEAMQSNRSYSARELGDKVRTSTQLDVPWPRISIWHGSSDTTVNPGNADNIARQWLDLHELAECTSNTEEKGHHTRQVWRDEFGRNVVEMNIVSGLNHGVPISTSATEPCGVTGPMFLESGVSSTSEIARFWGLKETPDQSRSPKKAAASKRRRLTSRDPEDACAKVPALSGQVLSVADGAANQDGGMASDVQ